MEGSITLLTTLDGSTTFYNQLIHQTYHSVNGAFQEAHHVFLENGLENFLSGRPPGPVNILEVGFGSGLNFLVTADYCCTHRISLSYTGLEPFPIQAGLFAESHYNKWLNNQKIWNNLVAGYETSLTHASPISLASEITLTLRQQKLMELENNEHFDLVYYDAFAPITQPEMWSREAIAHVTGLLKPGGHFITYSITGNLKRNLKSLGFIFEKPKGAAGKREMLRAYKAESFNK